MKTLKKYINESIWDIEDNVEDNNEEMIKNEIYEFLDKFYFCEERDNFKVASQTVQIIPDKNQFIVNCHCTVHGGVNLASLTNGMCKWGEVKGSFSCAGSSKLKSLEGAPEYVGADFWCIGCDGLKSLEGAPKNVGNDFSCGYCNNLTSLKGAPEKVNGSFDCSDCVKLKTLKGVPEEVGRYLYCGECPNLKITDSDRKKYKIEN